MSILLRALGLFGLFSFTHLSAATVGDWTFEEGVPGAAITHVHDVSGNRFHSTAVLGEPTYSTGPGGNDPVAMFTPPGGVFGSGFRVDEQLAFNLTNEFTLEARFRPGRDSITGANRTLIQRSDLTTFIWAYGLYYDPDRRQANVGIGAANGESVLIYADVPDDGRFHHVAGTFNRGVLSLFVDGVLKTNLTTELRPDPRPKLGLSFGAIWNGGFWFTGDLSQVRVSSTALSPGEFLPDAGDPVFVGDWSFEDGVGGTKPAAVRDGSGNQNHGVVIHGDPKYAASGLADGGLLSLQVSGEGGSGAGFTTLESPTLALPDDFTLEVIGRFSAASNRPAPRTLIQASSSTDSLWPYTLYYDGSTGKVGFVLMDAERKVADLQMTFPDDGFSHAVTAVKAGNELRLYLDGLLQAKLTTSLKPNFQPAHRVSVGANEIGGYWLDGILDRVRIARRALSPAEFLSGPAFVAGVPRVWWVQHFGEDFATQPDAQPDADPDADGSSNREEFGRGGDPKNPLSGFQTGLKLTPTVVWRSVPGIAYRVFRREAPEGAPVLVSPVMVADSTNSVFVDIGGDRLKAFYSVEPVIP